MKPNAPHLHVAHRELVQKSMDEYEYDGMKVYRKGDKIYKTKIFYCNIVPWETQLYRQCYTWELWCTF